MLQNIEKLLDLSLQILKRNNDTILGDTLPDISVNHDDHTWNIAVVSS